MNTLKNTSIFETKDLLLAIGFLPTIFLQKFRQIKSPTKDVYKELVIM